MHRHVIDRLADTTVFRCLLLFSAMAVLPVLFMAVTTTGFGLVMMLAGQVEFASDLERGELAIALLSIGGALGFLGYQRAHSGVKNPLEHNVTVTLAFLGAGVMAALSVAGFVLFTVVSGWLEPWGPDAWLVLLGASFAAANLVWAFSGIAWMQRLLSVYVEATGRAFDDLPVVLLFVAIGLATGAALTTTTL